MYENLLKPIDLGGRVLKNRIVFAPTSLGLPDKEYYEKIRSIAAGGCGMIVIGDVPVKGRGVHSLYSKNGFTRYQSLCRLVHEQDCVICAQLHQSDSNWKAMVKYVPGMLTKRISMEQLRVLLNQEVERYIMSLEEGEVSAITSSFGEAAALAKKAGFDMVQVHGDRMCGSFSSSVFNKRTDGYGGSAAKRARFAAEAVAAVRRALPDIPIDYKLAVRQEDPHYGNAGVLLEELPVFVPLLEKAGVTSFHVTLANHGKLTDTIPAASHPHFGKEGCFLPYCDEVKKLTGLPVCGVGGLTSPDFVEQQIGEGRIDCAAMSRQLIADPDWVRKVQAGKPQEIRRCVRCNKDCLGGMQRHEGVHCIYEEEKKNE